MFRTGLPALMQDGSGRNEYAEGHLVMTLQELSKHYKLKEQLQQDLEILESMRAKTAPGAPALTGMPHAPGVSDKVAFLAIEIADMSNRVEVLRAEIETERRKLETYISTIPDDRIRLIFKFRFIYCMSWKEVADTMGWSYTEKGSRDLVYSYLRKAEQQTTS